MDKVIIILYLVSLLGYRI